MKRVKTRKTNEEKEAITRRNKARKALKEASRKPKQMKVPRGTARRERRQNEGQSGQKKGQGRKFRDEPREGDQAA